MASKEYVIAMNARIEEPLEIGSTRSLYFSEIHEEK
jgi:hypothetical protein